MIGNKIRALRYRAKWGYRQVLFDRGWKRLKPQEPPFFRRILVYHGVVPQARTDINARFISAERFEAELEYFKAHFHLVSLQEFAQGAHHPEKSTLCLTFDDGYRNNLEVVLPLLERHQVPAAFYITPIASEGYDRLWADALDVFKLSGQARIAFDGRSYQLRGNEYQSNQGSLKDYFRSTGWEAKVAFLQHYIEEAPIFQDKGLFPYWQLMSREEVGQLARHPLVEIGSHGLFHNLLGVVPEKDAVHEMQRSKEVLEEWCGTEINSIAYPDDSYSPGVKDAAESLGYQIQLAVAERPMDRGDGRVFTRFGVNPYLGFENQMLALIEGKY